MNEAADYCPSDEECELEALREQNAAMLEALRQIANGDGVYGLQAHEYKQIARAAIAAAEADND